MMDKSQILKKIGNIIEELGEQQQYLASTNKINLLELELFTANADFLIDHIEILKKITEKRYDVEQVTPPNPTRQSEVSHIEEPKTDEKPLEIPAEEERKNRFSFSLDEEPTEMIFDFEKKIAVEEVFDRPLSNDELRLLEEKSNAPVAEPEEFIVLDEKQPDSENTLVDEEEDIEPFLMIKEDTQSDVVEKHSVVTDKVENTIVPQIPVRKVDPIPEEVKVSQPSAIEVNEQHLKSDHQFSAVNASDLSSYTNAEKPLTLNEMLSAKLNKASGPSNHRQGKKLEDLKAAISINDKMVFIKELFNGYNLAYSEAIEIVNRFESFEAADNFLQKNYSIKNDWEHKQVTVDRFYEYLNKKFVI